MASPVEQSTTFFPGHSGASTPYLSGGPSKAGFFFLFHIHSAVGQASRRLSLTSSSLDQDFQNNIGLLQTKILPKAMECFHLWGHASNKGALRIWVPCVSSGTQDRLCPPGCAVCLTYCLGHCGGSGLETSDSCLSGN